LSQTLIGQYLTELDRLRQVSGSRRELVLREAFKALLKNWDYRLGNRCAIDWVPDQHKEKKPKDPTIRAKFDTYRFADHKERVIDLLVRVATVSLETLRIVEAMKEAPR
jgi:hypothetical protein